MPIKPMDMQVLMPNIRKAAHQEIAKQAKEESALQQQQMKEDKDLEVNRNKVAHLEKKDQNAIKEDQHHNKSEERQKKKKKEEEEEEKKKKLIKDRESKFDMKV